MTIPTVIDVHDSTLPAVAYALSSTSAGTLIGVDKHGPGGVFGLSAPMSVAAHPFPIVERSGYSLTRISLFGSVIALPELDDSGSYRRIARVRYGSFGSGSSLGSVTIPPGKVYLTSVGVDGFLVYDFASRELQLLTASGTRAVSRIPAGSVIDPTYESAFTASSDGIVAAVSLTGFNYFARLAPPGAPVGEAVELPWANDLVLTPTYVVGWRLDVTGVVVGRLRRDAIPASGTAPDWTVLYTNGTPGYYIYGFSATDQGLAWTTPTGTGADPLYSLATPAGGGTSGPVAYVRPVRSPALSPFEGTGDVLLCDADAATPGLYRLTPGSSTGTLVGRLGPRWSMTSSLAVSHGRAAYSDDTTATYPLFIRDVSNPVSPGAESQVAPASGFGPAISGPFIAFGIPVSGTGASVVYGRIGSSLTTVTLPAGDVARIRLSGHRLLITGGVDSWLLDVLTGVQTNLGHVFAAVWGDQLVTVNYDTALLQRRNLLTGAVVTIRPAEPGCTSYCVDEELWNLAAWGTRTVFSYSHGGAASALVVGIHDTATGVTSPLPMLPHGAYALDYGDDLLLAYGPPLEVRLFDLRSTPAGEVLLDGYAERPLALDGYIAAWRPDSDLRAVVQDVRAAFPGYALSAPRYLNGAAPTLFPTTGSPWRPRFYVTRDVDWTIELRSASTTVRRLTGSSVSGEIAASWDGLDDSGATVPSGSYSWTLTGVALDGKPLRNADGTSSVAASGTLVSDPIAAKRAEPAMAFLGPETGARVHYPDGGQGQPFQHGWIYYSAATGAHEVHGAILTRYLALGGPGGFVGYPTSDELAAAGGGRESRFVHARIYWSSATGAHEVHGAILTRYLALGGPGGFVGYPISDELAAAGGGRESRFAHARIYWSSATGAHEVHGAVLDRYLALGGPGGLAGYPTTDGAPVPGVPGARMSTFARSNLAVYWSTPTGAHEVHGAIRAYYLASAGGPAGSLGLPVTDEYAVTGGRESRFEHGRLTWNAATRTVTRH